MSETVVPSSSIPLPQRRVEYRTDVGRSSFMTKRGTFTIFNWVVKTQIESTEKTLTEKISHISPCPWSIDDIYSLPTDLYVCSGNHLKGIGTPRSIGKGEEKGPERPDPGPEPQPPLGRRATHRDTSQRTTLSRRQDLRQPTFISSLPGLSGCKENQSDGTTLLDRRRRLETRVKGKPPTSEHNILSTCTLND